MSEKLRIIARIEPGGGALPPFPVRGPSRLMDTRSAARALGGDVIGRNRVSCPGPGHEDKGDRSLAVTFDASAPDGFLVHSFSGDDFRACRDHVRALLGLGSFEGPGRRERSVILPKPAMASPDASAVRKRDFAASIWSEARPIGGTPAETYLAGRNINLPGDVYTGRALRFHPACGFQLNSGETVRLPAMVAAMVNIETGAFQGVHRTALQPDGNGKARVRGLDNPRKMLGSAKGACVRLSSDENVTNGLFLAEGIETTLSVMGIGFAPVWAALSAGTLASFPVLSGVESLTVFADNDQSGTGTRAARECAERWVTADRECVIWTPPDIGTDFNDLAERAAA